MPAFAYIARDLQGQKVSGTIEAATERDAINMLSGKSLFPIQVDAEKAAMTFSFGRVKGQVMATTFAPATTPLCAIGVAIATAFDQW